MPSDRRPRRTLAALVVAAATLAGCGSADEQPTGAAAVPAALEQPTTLTFWTWVPNIEKAIDRFETAHPKIKIDVVNAGQGPDHYLRLQNTLDTKIGAPDLAQVEYFALPQFATSGKIADLTPYGVTDLKDRFTASAWSQVLVEDRVYGIPQDTGPMVMFYRKDVFDRLGLEPPTTWDEYRQAGQRIKREEPGTYIASLDPVDFGTVGGLIWQAGGRPFTNRPNKSVGVNLTADAGVDAFAEVWGSMLAEGAVEPATQWTDEWWKAMAEGRYATWVAGAWAQANLEKWIPETSGQWAVAPMPRWDPAKPTAAEHGGSSVAVTAVSKHKAAAVAFAQWLNSDPEGAASLNADVRLFPATKALLEDPAFREQPAPFFGGQPVNQVFAEASRGVSADWQFLPYQAYANTVFDNTVGKAISGESDLGTGLGKWQESITRHGRENGFTVSSP
ncbi:multiple sugar transport system substrate-binding protein [Saccharothrix ecbatanensis]|uniref:Multiple sugar transport system substrate-binding protein n=1 Tax=Saccharothrix ecbatanensis TaxID=1105145 RepID=A0A7W9HII0_9PSEU|nr:sugar ABC transporter substrate-binding protein [Saccharothrix ecbatanensis]MBB5802923.1 multiple sugar transport system substrate-binding protein [Saccharothrix ecbatanensis]